jgi:hypothetical protein
MKRFMYILVCILFLSLNTMLSAATWRVLLYADSSDNLSDMLIKNITEVIQGRPNDEVEFYIQLHAYYQTGLRYQVTQQGLQVIEEVQLTDDNKQDFINGLQWGFANSTADHTMLIIGSHGWGILDPRWNEQTNEWQVNEGGSSNVCTITKSRNHIVADPEEHKFHRGFLFTIKPRTYLSNQKLFEGLRYITDTVLHKKLDVLAFDTCMGDMLEIGYGAASFAHYLVGNQSCSLPDGFPYKDIVDALNAQRAPGDLVKAMVRAFDNRYAQDDTSGIYTHGALDLQYINDVCDALDGIVAQLLTMPELATNIINACNDSPRFCLWPMYTDPVAWAHLIERELEDMPQSDAITKLKSALQRFYATIPSLVVARCGGFSTAGRAHGFAIYLPEDAIDDSYYTTDFARDHLWVKLLEYMRSVRFSIY